MKRRAFMQESMKYALLAPLVPGMNAYSLMESEVNSPIGELQDSGYFDHAFEPDNEEAWSGVAALFPKPKDFTQLENGYFSQASLAVRALHQNRENYIQNRSSIFMRREQEQAVLSARKALANFLKWPASSIAMTRNTTESMNVMIMGFPWRAGDEVIVGDQDYGSMNEAFEQAAKRFGIVIKKANIPLLPKNDQEIVDAYMRHWSGKTRMLHLTHLINLSGQVIPLAPIISAARSKNADVFVAVDAAHSVAHIETAFHELDIDGLGASLHKWLGVPLGVGVLYLKDKWIPEIWPLFGDVGKDKSDISRFEHQGTKPIQSLECIAEAVKLVEAMGGVPARHARLHYLQNYWTKRLEGSKKIKINTPTDIARSGAIANVSYSEWSPDQLANYLWSKHQIFSVAINHEVVKGVRITPHFSNSVQDVEVLFRALNVLG